MKILTKVVKFFRKITNTRECIEVWDTSAISTWLDLLVKKVNAGKTKIVIVEGVIHELSVGRHKFEKARNAYFYVKDTKQENLLKLVTEDKIRTWSVDEQIVYVAEKYHKAGHDVKLVTCDQCQALRAEMKGLNIALLDGSRELPKGFEIKRSSKVVATSGENDINKFGSEIKLDCKKCGDGFYIPLISGMEVYDNRGKRRFGKENTLQILKTDKILYYNSEYIISEQTDNKIVLTRC